MSKSEIFMYSTMVLFIIMALKWFKEDRTPKPFRPSEEFMRNAEAKLPPLRMKPLPSEFVSTEIKSGPSEFRIRKT